MIRAPRLDLTTERRWMEEEEEEELLFSFNSSPGEELTAAS